MAKNHGVGPARPRAGRPKRKELIEVRPTTPSGRPIGNWVRIPRRFKLSQTLDGRLYDAHNDVYWLKGQWRVNGYWSGRKAVQA